MDEIYESVKFGELQYSSSHVLENVAPTAFRIGVIDYADSEVDDGRMIELNS